MEFNAVAISPDGGSFYVTDIYNQTVNQYDIGTVALTQKSTPSVPADLIPNHDRDQPAPGAST